MKTIFIPIFQGVEARNILRTDIFKILRAQNDLRIVLFVPNKQKEEYFKNEFFGENIFYEILDNYKKPSFHRAFTFLKFILIKTGTMDLRRKIEFLEKKNHLRYYLYWILNRILAHKFLRRIVRWLDWKLVRDGNFKEFFDKYKPDLVFLAHLFGDGEISILRQSRRRGIKSIGLINSWDKITSRCMIRLLPDKLIVHNFIMKQEAMYYVDMPEKDIIVVGIPHYDVFVNSKPSPKENFYKKIGVNISKRILLFCPIGKAYSDIDAEMLNQISDFQTKNLIPQDVQILVRFPPNDIVDLTNIKNQDKLIFTQPGVRFTMEKERRVDWDMNDADIQLLLDSLFYASLIICPASSISIDAAVFNKPIINYCLKSEHILPPRDGGWLYNLSHYQSILKSGGVTLVKDKKALLEWTNKYLENMEIASEGRRKIVEQQCWKLDGKAGARAANVILESL